MKIEKEKDIISITFDINDISKELLEKIKNNQIEDLSKRNSKKITNFTNFSIYFDTIIEGGIDLIDDKGQFSGKFTKSKNGKFLTAFNNGMIYKKNKAPAQIYLIEDEKKIIWRKEYKEISDFLVCPLPLNDGSVIIFETDYNAELYEDKLITEEKDDIIIRSYMHVFDVKGNELFKYPFPNLLGCCIQSEDEKELIVASAFPENALYLFDLISFKLVKIVNSPYSQVLTEIDFTHIKKQIEKLEPYKKIVYPWEP